MGTDNFLNGILSFRDEISVYDKLSTTQILLESNINKNIYSWRRGETFPTSSGLMHLNDLTSEKLSQRAMKLIDY